MTGEQAKQYEICKARRHEEMPIQTMVNANLIQSGMQNASPWKTCRWCGTQFQEVQETRQVERS
jgi:hypothetical protein